MANKIIRKAKRRCGNERLFTSTKDSYYRKTKEIVKYRGWVSYCNLFLFINLKYLRNFIENKKKMMYNSIRLKNQVKKVRTIHNNKNAQKVHTDGIK